MKITGNYFYSLIVLLAWFAGVGRTTAGTVALTWNPSRDTDVVGYKVYYGTAREDLTAGLMVGNVTRTTINGLANGTTYYFAAVSFDAVGDESVFSNEASYAVPNPSQPANAPTLVNSPTTLNAIPNLTLSENAGTQTVVLTGIAPGATTSSHTLKVTVVSSNPALIPAPIISYRSPAATGTLTFAPARNASGSATITITVNNGAANNNLATRAFTITVSAPTQQAAATRAVTPTVSKINIATASSPAHPAVAVRAVTPTVSKINIATVSSPAHLAVATRAVTSTVSKNKFVTVSSPAHPTVATRAVTPTVSKINIVTLSAPARPAVVAGTVTPTVSKNEIVAVSLPADPAVATRAVIPTVAKNEIVPVSLSAAPAADAPAVNPTISENEIVTLTPQAALDRGQFRFTVSGVSGNQYVVEASTDLVQWTPVQTNTAPFDLLDANAGAYTRRFYRARAPR